MDDASASQQIEAIVWKTAGWRGERLGQPRALIRAADPDVIEEVKWRRVGQRLSRRNTSEVTEDTGGHNQLGD